MNHTKIFWTGAAAVLLLLDGSLCYVRGYCLSDFTDGDTVLLLVLYPAFFIAIGVLLAFVVSSLLQGRFVKNYFRRFAVASLVPALLAGLWLPLSWRQRQEERAHATNQAHNERYLPFFGDDRDSAVSRAMRALYADMGDAGEGRIFRMRVLERDTVLAGSPARSYDVRSLYYLGREFQPERAYAARYIVTDTDVWSLFSKEPIQGKTGAAQFLEIESVVKKTATGVDGAAVQARSLGLAMEVVKLYE